jgi:hypothetical protein
MPDAGPARDFADTHDTLRGGRRRATDGEITFIVPNDDQQIAGPFVRQCRQRAQVKEHAAVSVEGDDFAMGRA